MNSNPTSSLIENNFSWSTFLESLLVRRMLFIFGLIWIILREPLLFVHTRFWAEEGIIFYSSALFNSLLENLSTPQVGYYTVFNVLISEFATLFPPEAGPLITTLSAFFITLVPLYIISFTQSVFWDNFYKRLFAILLVVTFAPPEIWLNTTNIHCYFGLISFLILLINYDHCSSIQLWIFRIFNILGILTGPESMFISFGYFWKAYKEKTRESRIQAGIVFLCSLIQAGVIIFSLVYANTYKRGESFSLAQFITTYFCDGFGMLLPIGINDKKIIGMFVAVFMLYLFFKRKSIKEFQYLGLAFVTVSVFSVLGALGMESAPRYSYLPSCILVIFLLYEAFQFIEIRSKIYLLKVSILIIVFSFNIVYYRSKLLSFTEPIKGPPVWKEEVARWRKDKSYMPQVRPILENTEMRMKLSK